MYETVSPLVIGTQEPITPEAEIKEYTPGRSGLGRLAAGRCRLYARQMTERYEPSSDFLKAVAAEQVPLSGSAFADVNMRQLIAMTRDDDVFNRDWATMLLASRKLIRRKSVRHGCRP
jgi:hypothetical protein